MYLRATAKINLALDVIGKRPDGYHDVRMVMQMVGMYDQIYLTAHPSHEKSGTAGSEAGLTGGAENQNKEAGERSSGDGADRISEGSTPEAGISPERKPRITLRTNLPYIPKDESNLAVRAARLLMEKYDVTDNLDIRLDKFIPVAAGLAGGSSDAAMTLVGVNRLFHLGCTEKELRDIGGTIGADVPYCIMRGTALSEGTGELLSPLPPMPECSILLCKPPVGVSTREVYSRLDLEKLGPEQHPDVDRMIRALTEGNLADVCAKSTSSGRPVMGNVLENVTGGLYPVIGEIEQVMMENGALNAVMSGSGPTVFGVFDDEGKASACRKALRAEYPRARTFLTWPENRSGAGSF